MTKTLLITGVSSGLGRAFAAAALDAGNTVVGTLRNPHQLDAFEALAPGRAHAITLDVTDTSAIGPAIETIEENIAPIDVLVNNAGFGVEGVLEETSLDTFRHQFDVNVFGAVAVTQAVLPYFRARRSGHVIYITSMGGLTAFPGLCAYHGSKYAMEGIADSLRKEVAQFGIHVTSIEPGGFRTDWAGRSMTRVARSIPDYDDLMNPIREGRNQMSGHQLGDPVKAGLALLEVISSTEPPAHLLLGSDARRLVKATRDEFDAEFARWKDLGESTDFPDGRALG